MILSREAEFILVNGTYELIIVKGALIGFALHLNFLSL
jgi:hypothetical protein